MNHRFGFASIVALIAACSTVHEAGAILQIFFTSSAQPYGLADPALAFQPTLAADGDAGHDSEHYQVAAFPPLSAWGETPEITASAGEFAYIWARFSNESNSRKVQSLTLDLTGSPANVAYYLVNNLANGEGQRRWDVGGELRDDPQILTSDSSYGVRNRMLPVDAWNLYDASTRTALLGAVRYPPHVGLVSAAGDVIFSPGAPGVLAVGAALWAPEPASLMLIAAIGLLLRAR